MVEGLLNADTRIVGDCRANPGSASGRADYASVTGDSLADHIFPGARAEEDGETGNVLRGADPAARIALGDRAPVDVFGLAAKTHAGREHPGRKRPRRDRVEQDV